MPSRGHNPARLLILIILLSLVTAVRAADDAHAPKPTVLGVAGTRFTLNDKPTFLLGISYYAALGAPQDFVRADLDDMQRHGFNFLRVFVTWGAFDRDVSAVDARGEPRQPFFDRLQWLVTECDRRGLVVDLTIARGKVDPPKIPPGHVPDLPAHLRAVEVITTALKDHRNWYLDLANEHDVRDDRYVPVAQLKTLRDRVRQLDPKRLVTASFGGHDLDESDVRDALLTAGLDFLAPHRPRDPQSPAQTQGRTKDCLDLMRKTGHLAPVHYQEPFRRGYTQWNPTAKDFLTDLRGAVAGGAAGWCFHNGSEHGTPKNLPRRSFDLTARRLFDQLDPEEQKVVAGVKAAAVAARDQKEIDHP
jgi:hypothetical protein